MKKFGHHWLSWSMIKLPHHWFNWIYMTWKNLSNYWFGWNHAYSVSDNYIIQWWIIITWSLMMKLMAIKIIIQIFSLKERCVKKLWAILIQLLKKQRYTTYRVTSHSKSQLPSNTFSSWQSRVTLMVISGTQVTFHQCRATSYCSGDLTVVELPTLPYIINLLWPSDAIWHHGSGSPFAQVVACCLMAPSHYLICSQLFLWVWWFFCIA